ncbi:glycosyltransferase family 2 protein [Streptomyces sp. NPDC020731]|uniref:glycosyltransferase family 2 protein n=1 Tax=Streptomyces sp. NPDC020731 TaxID=3365085 RepID=UPI0037A22895
MPPALSIGITVFNVELCLAACLDSLVDPHLAGTEIIVVDDGSTDRSRSVADKWAHTDPRTAYWRNATRG